MHVLVWHWNLFVVFWLFGFYKRTQSVGSHSFNIVGSSHIARCTTGPNIFPAWRISETGCTATRQYSIELNSDDTYPKTTRRKVKLNSLFTSIKKNSTIVRPRPKSCITPILISSAVVMSMSSLVCTTYKYILWCGLRERYTDYLFYPTVWVVGVVNFIMKVSNEVLNFTRNLMCLVPNGNTVGYELYAGPWHILPRTLEFSSYGKRLGGETSVLGYNDFFSFFEKMQPPVIICDLLVIFYSSAHLFLTAFESILVERVAMENDRLYLGKLK